MGATIRFIDRDKGWRRIVTESQALNGSHTKVGVQQGESRDDMTDQVIVAVANEYGTERIPERSFLRSTVDKQKNAIFALQAKLYNDMLAGKRRMRPSLALLGEFVQGKIRNTIRELKSPPNAASTIAQKGSDNPLVDTGELIQDIRHVEVVI